MPLWECPNWCDICFSFSSLVHIFTCDTFHSVTLPPILEGFSLVGLFEWFVQNLIRVICHVNLTTLVLIFSTSYSVQFKLKFTILVKYGFYLLWHWFIHSAVTVQQSYIVLKSIEIDPFKKPCLWRGRLVDLFVFHFSGSTVENCSMAIFIEEKCFLISCPNNTQDSSCGNVSNSILLTKPGVTTTANIFPWFVCICVRYVCAFVFCKYLIFVQ